MYAADRRHFLDFEQPLATVWKQLQNTPEDNPLYTQLQQQLLAMRHVATSHLSAWQTVQLSRHINRPDTLTYLQHITTGFTELHGDRYVHDDKSIVGGLATFNGQTVMFIGHEKGHNLPDRQYRNFGMPHPPGYRKALRLMKLAEKFQKPVVTFINTPGAYPGVASQLQGGGEAIARAIYETLQLRIPVIAVITGEGGSGGALGIGAGDVLLMQQHTWCSVVSPESCSAILWHNSTAKEVAAEQLRLTAAHMLQYGLITGIIPEPTGGAHWDTAQAASHLHQAIAAELEKLSAQSPESRIRQRIEKYAAIGFWEQKN
ncbi:acetyl-CoA carboxylase carboxyl transferase subunit alpha [Filimonas zeae]|uniref:Acetyl-coenzyme A carboxylase carboxyl transferase subunit alpha n=1 Tax=Filimonas zeae TaxID=1737353 RepID=A0A917J3C8_9BACT|nr:acetyl-CoA carboxylase carboxyltransferase subunit alpha [Filimonas zeae]MDR6341177.1 acetyl-CoA carboxylase carboxyl transferase subunit alpha [Filimonas zeae]GGH76916.1 acetyl-coenzyme A carboxylase carboxyl transferase subunit alpha [Filimonas zeae]